MRVVAVERTALSFINALPLACNKNLADINGDIVFEKGIILQVVVTQLSRLLESLAQRLCAFDFYVSLSSSLKYHFSPPCIEILQELAQRIFNKSSLPLSYN